MNKEKTLLMAVGIPLLIVALAAAYYFVVYMPKYQEEELLEQKNEQANTNAFSDQEKCADAASSFYTKAGYSLGSAENGYVDHWNESLKRCFIEFSSGGLYDNLGNPTITYELADAIGGTEYAEIDWSIPNEDNPRWCIIYPDGNGLDSNSENCKSKAEFDDFVNPYMSN